MSHNIPSSLPKLRKGDYAEFGHKGMKLLMFYLELYLPHWRNRGKEAYHYVLEINSGFISIIWKLEINDLRSDPKRCKSLRGNKV